MKRKVVQQTVNIVYMDGIGKTELKEIVISVVLSLVFT
jgi:hypothetical protein